MRRGALLVLTLLTVASCTPDDPLQQLAQSRQAIEVSLRTWVESAAPPPALPEAADSVTDVDASVDVTGAETAGDTPEAGAEAVPVVEQALPREAHLSLLVADRGAILPLDCLTLDVVFEAGEGDAAREVGRIVREIDISRLHEVGGGLDVTLRVPLPDEAVTGIGVQLHPASLEELDALCEAGVLARDDG